MGIDRPFLIDIPAEWRGPRSVLRRWRDEDAPALFEAVVDSREHVRQWEPWADTYQSIDDATEFIRRQSGHWALHEHLGFGIFAPADGGLLGGIGLHIRDLRVPAFEIGYWIRRTAAGQGYVSEATRMITSFAFDRLGARRVMIRCDARNVRSARVPERVGYVREARLRCETIATDGAIRDTLVYAMIREDYERARASWAL